VASRHGSRPIGNSTLGAILVFFGRSISGSMPRCRTNTRLGVSANTPWPAPHVHLPTPGTLDSGFGQSITFS
jgi:hypothetical protein